MISEHFVGRHEANKQLALVLKGEARADVKLTIQSIEGPGGIGKTHLLNHVMLQTNLADQKYLCLKLGGDESSARSLVRAVSQMLNNATAEAIRDRGYPGRYYFPSVDRVIKTIETIQSEALAEFQQLRPSDQEGKFAFLRFLDFVFSIGKRINEAVPITKQYVNMGEMHVLLEEVVPKMQSLLGEIPKWYEHLDLGIGKTALRNAIKENVYRPLSEAFLTDLSAILSGYRRENFYKPSHSRIPGADRLLLILDDYESVQWYLEDFLVNYFLPDLLIKAKFETVAIILGRDQLQATHPAWDQHLKSALLKPIVLETLNRDEVNALVESYDIRDKGEKERAWRDTKGYPIYVQFWIEEIESGGRGALMLKRFYDRTTRWMNDEQKRWLQFTLFLDEVNVRSLRVMIGNAEEADNAFRWFEAEGSVRDTIGNAFRVREYLRSRLLDYLLISDPDRYEELERKNSLVHRDIPLARKTLEVIS